MAIILELKGWLFLEDYETQEKRDQFMSYGADLTRTINQLTHLVTSLEFTPLYLSWV